MGRMYCIPYTSPSAQTARPLACDLESPEKKGSVIIAFLARPGAAFSVQRPTELTEMRPALVDVVHYFTLTPLQYSIPP